MEAIIKDKIADARVELEDSLRAAVDEAVEDIESRSDREASNNIMHIGEYSDGVLKQMDETNTRITFMYSMLNDKQESLVGITKDIQNLQDELNTINSSIAKKMELLHEKEAELEQREKAFAMEVIKEAKLQKTEAPVSPAAKTDFVTMAEMASKPASEAVSVENYMEQAALNSENSFEASNTNLDILRLHDEGFTEVEIARKLNRGLGEVKFVLGLYQEG
ncbi:MAG: hypothetical protein HUJ75_08800 [Parasporobacterium sp.]|nr:hypothetical protein [Parasporobacterium sp.]